MQRKKRAPNNYINAEEFLNEMIQSQKDGKCTDRLGELLITLHDHVLTMSRFVKKPQHIKDEAKSFSIYRILKRGILTFDTTSTARRCFNYFTTAAVTNMTRACQMMDAYYKKHQELGEQYYTAYREKQPYKII